MPKLKKSWIIITLNYKIRTRNGATSLVGVAGVSRDAVADRVVVHDLALCVGSAHSRTRVDTLLQGTRLVVRAVVVGGTLRTAADDGVALEVGEATADSHTIPPGALGVGATR